MKRARQRKWRCCWQKYLASHKWEHLGFSQTNAQYKHPVLYLNLRDFAHAFHFHYTVLKMLIIQFTVLPRLGFS